MGATKFPLVPPPQGGTPNLPVPGQPSPMRPGEFVVGSVPDISTFAFRGIDPPTGLYIKRDDQIQLAVISNQAGESVLFRIRFLRMEEPVGGQPDTAYTAGKIQTNPVPASIIVVEKQLAITALRTVALTQFGLGEGYILSITATATVAVTRGQTYAVVGLFRGAGANPSFTQNFGSEYLDQNFTTSWPSATVRHYVEGAGWIHSIQQGNPAVTTDWTFACLPHQRLRIDSFTAQLVTTAAAGNRNIEVIVDDGVNVVWRTSAPASVSVSTTQQLSGTGSNQPTGVVTTDFTILIPPGLELTNGWRIRTVTANMQAGDQWSNIWFNVEEWLEF